MNTLGVTGGDYSDPPGAVGRVRFHDLRGVGVDAAGQIHVVMGSYDSGTKMRSFTPDGQQNWNVFGLTFVDSPAVDPASDGTDVYTQEKSD